MNDLFIAGIAVLIVCIVASRRITEKALRYLNSEQKANLLDSFSTQQKFRLIPFMLIFISYIAVHRSFPHVGTIIYIIFIAFIIVYFTVTQIITSKKLSQLTLPKQYLKLYALSRLVYYIGLVCLLGPIIADVISGI